MLYKLNKEENSIDLMPYQDFSKIDKLEKDLENLLADNLSELYVEDGQLMTIFQERQWQEEPDLCALDKDGNLVLFELKRENVSGNTTMQVMRYAQSWGQMSYNELEEYYFKYLQKKELDAETLRDAHKEAFGLDTPLACDKFNKIQRLIIVGSSSDIALIDAVDYWKRKGVLIDFIPYRLYEIDGEYYFEFFSKPYDIHINPQDKKGIIFDTNRSYDEDAIWDMIGNKKVSAYGNAATDVNSFKKGDYVFYYHKGWGIVAGGIIKSDVTKENKNNEELYKDVDMITPSFCSYIEIRYIPYAELKSLLNKGFYLAKTRKVPYLNKEECEKVLKCLKEKYL